MWDKLAELSKTSLEFSDEMLKKIKGLYYSQLTILLDEELKEESDKE